MQDEQIRDAGMQEAPIQRGLGLRMHAERTPNPNSIKWVLGENIVETPANFEAPPSAAASPLAAVLFGVEGVVGVFFAANFATVSKRDDIDWVDIAQPIVDALKAHFDSGEPALGPDFEPAPQAPSGELVARICRMLSQHRSTRRHVLRGTSTSAVQTVQR